MTKILHVAPLAALTAMLMLAATAATTGCVDMGGGDSMGVSSSSGATTTNDATTMGGATSGDNPTGAPGSTGGISSTEVATDSSSGGANSSGGDTTSGESGTSGSSDSSGGESTGGAQELAVDLGTAGNFVILAKAGISTVPKSTVTGNIGVSPAASTYITGFSLKLDGSNAFSTSKQVTGKVYAADYAVPTPAELTTAIGDMEIAFADAASRTPDVLELGAGDIGGMTLPAGVYKWGTGLLIPTDVTLEGGAEDVWVFQVAQELTVANAVDVSLVGGALPKNVFWQVEGAVTMGTTVHFAGTVLGQTSIALKTGTSVDGRLLAQTAVTMGSNTVTQPAP